MVSNSILYMVVFSVGFLLWIDSINAAIIHNKDNSDDSTLVKAFDDDQDDTVSSVQTRGSENHNFPNEFQGIMLGKRRFMLRGVRLPAESILLGKRRLPVEAVLLGRRSLPDEDVVHNERR